MLTHYEEYSDVDLVRCYQKGDEKAGNVLCQRHWGALYRFFKKKIRNNEDAQDLVQETFFEALKTLKSGQPPRNFRCWKQGHARCLKGDIFPEFYPFFLRS